MVIINITEKPVSQRHIQYIVEKDSLADSHARFPFKLFELVERTYNHPQAPEESTIKDLEIIPVETKTIGIQALASLMNAEQVAISELIQECERRLKK